MSHNLLEPTEEQPAERALDPADTSLGRTAHDLKNLLGVVLGFADVVLRDLDPDDPRREDVLEIKKAGQDALAITTKLVD